MTGRALERFVAAMPKAELHVHLEGSMRPETLLRLAKTRRVGLPATDVEGLTRWFEFRDFEHFVEIYVACSKCLLHPEDFQAITEDFLEEQERQNVRYTEAHFTIGTHLSNGVSGSEVADALAETIGKWEARGVVLRLIPDIVRNVEFKWADRTLEWALDQQGRTVVALGLSGFEDRPDEPFREHFAEARVRGLGRVAHAGEHGGPESIRSVLAVCDVQRIGHGVAAARDPELMATLADLRVPLEVCPTSNVCLGVVPDLASHPFGTLHRAGLEVTVNSDDPPLFNTTLTGEYLAVAETWGLTAEELAGLSLRALERSFLPEGRREALAAEFREGFARLGGEHLDRTVLPAGHPPES